MDGEGEISPCQKACHQLLWGRCPKSMKHIQRLFCIMIIPDHKEDKEQVQVNIGQIMINLKSVNWGNQRVNFKLLLLYFGPWFTKIILFKKDTSILI